MQHSRALVTCTGFLPTFRRHWLDLEVRLTFRTNSYLVKITDYLIKKAETLKSLLVNVIFVIELLVIGDRREHDGDATVPLMV